MYNHHQYPSDGPAQPNPTGRGFQDYVRWFIRKFWILLITVTCGYFLGLYIYSQTPETFRSSATIEILRVKKEAADVDEEEKIKMNGMAEMLSASEKLRLPALYDQIASGYLFEDRDEVFPDRFYKPWEKKAERQRDDVSDGALGSMMRNWVDVRWRRDTKLLDIYATHTDPAVARDVLVGLLAEYERSTESKVADTSEYALDYILDNTTRIKDRIVEIEGAVQLYDRCKELNDEIRMVESRIAEMEKRYLPKWPALAEAREHSRILKERFSQELVRVIRLSEDEREFWEKNQDRLNAESEETLANDKLRIVATRSRSLERELNSEQGIYDNLVTKLKEGNVSKGFASKQFDVVQPPSLPSSPMGPDRKGIISKYTMTGGMAGVAVILLLGFLDTRVRTVSELESVTAKPVIGAIPMVSNANESDPLVIHSQDMSPQAESIRTLRAGLTFLGTPESKRTFLITSAVPNEGKSWVAANLALAFAKQKERVLLIDGDLRRPRQHEIFDFERELPGLSDRLSLRTPLKDIVKQSNLSKKLYILPAGSPSASPSELLSGKNLPALMEKLGEYFDRIIIDSAPITSVSDSYALAKVAQSVVLVCRIGATPRGAIQRALRILRENRTDAVGVVANCLPNAKTKLGYGYYYSYPGSGYETYAEERQVPQPAPEEVLPQPVVSNSIDMSDHAQTHERVARKTKQKARNKVEVLSGR